MLAIPSSWKGDTLTDSNGLSGQVRVEINTHDHFKRNRRTTDSIESAA